MSANWPSPSLSESTVRIPVDLRRFPWIRRLATDYAYNFGAVAPFFGGNPANRSDWASALSRTQAHPRRREEIASIVTAQQRRRGAPPAAIESAHRLADKRSVAIVTGQQAGLFGGPLFTLLKSLTALKLAEQVSRDHDVPAIAVFWIEAEDHDWDEVRSCTVFDDQLEPRSVALPGRAAAESVPVARITLDTSIGDVIDDLGRILPETEFSPALLEQLREAYAPGIGMSEAFGRWLERTLGNRGLVVYDALDPGFEIHRCGCLCARALGTRPDRPACRSRRSGIDGARLSRAGATARRQPRALSHRHGAAGDSSTGRPVLDRRGRLPRLGVVAGIERATCHIQSRRPLTTDRPGHALSDGVLRRRTE